MTAERYTAVFTGFLTVKKPGEYSYLAMSDDPSTFEDSALRCGRPPYEHMGSEIPFKDLPEDCKRLILDTYRELWGLEGSSAGPVSPEVPKGAA